MAQHTWQHREAISRHGPALMTPRALNDWERIEVERSAFEASQVDLESLRGDEAQIVRYLSPAADTCYPLEYSFHLLGDVRGKTVLEYGCGDGLNTLVLARRGAVVNAIDISAELIDVARRRLVANGLSGNVEFIVASAHNLPMRNECIDLVFGIAILHHLDLDLSAREVQRVLRHGGRAIFQEPVRNSRVLRFVRGLIPYRPPDVSPFERPLTDAELETYAAKFSSSRSRAFLFPTTSLIRIVPPLRRRFLESCYRLDASVLRRLPHLARYATVQVLEVAKE